MSITAALQDVLGCVRPELERMNDELVGDLHPRTAEIQPLLEHVARYRGKQLRPALVFLTGKMFGGPAEAHYTCAKVVELIHTATLVHDDILDGATVRRREPTINHLHGNEVPVLLGDFIYALAFHMAVGLEDPTCARLFSDAVRTVCQGEITQCLHRGDTTWDQERYYAVIREKTASLYGAACKVGAHYGGATTEQIDALGSFGNHIGMAFQVIDDCLDLVGDEAVVGKSLGTDLDLGKITLPLIHLLEHSGDRRPELEALLGGAERSGSLRELRAEFDVDSSVAYALAQAAGWVRRGVVALETLPAGPSRDALAAVADYVLRRNL